MVMLYFVALFKDRRIFPQRIEASSEAEARAIAESQFPDAHIHSVRPMPGQ